MRPTGDMFFPDPPRKPFLRDWGPFLAFCALGTFLFVGALGPLGFVAFYGTLLLLGFIVWLPGALCWRERRDLVDLITRLTPRQRRRFMSKLPPGVRRPIRRWLAKHRITTRRNSPAARDGTE